MPGSVHDHKKEPATVDGIVPAALAGDGDTILASLDRAVSDRAPARGVASRGSAVRYLVPNAAFVRIGRAGAVPLAAGAVPLGSGKSRSANDNFSPPGARKSVWRELFFLTLLVLTLAGAFWTGRMHYTQKVIVVPGPSSFYSVVT